MSKDLLGVHEYNYLNINQLKKLSLIERYHSLDPLRKRIIQIAVLLFRFRGFDVVWGSNISSTHTPLYKLLLVQLIQDNDGGKITEKEYRLLVDSLTLINLLDKDSFCPFELIHPISKIAVSKENVAYNLKIIQEVFGSNLLITNFSSWNPMSWSSDSWIYNKDYIRLHIAIYTNDLNFLNNLAKDNEAQLKTIAAYYYMYNNLNFDEEWFLSRNENFQQILVLVNLLSKLNFPVKKSNNLELWFMRLKTIKLNKGQLELKLINNLFLQLYIVKAEYSLLEGSNNSYAELFAIATKALLNNDFKTALKFYDESIRKFSLSLDRNYWYYLRESSVLYVITLIHQKKYNHILSIVIRRTEKVSQLSFFSRCLMAIYGLLNNDLELANQEYIYLSKSYNKFIEEGGLENEDLLNLALYYWVSWLVTPQTIKINVLQEVFNKTIKTEEYLATQIIGEIILANSKNEPLLKQLNKLPYFGLKIVDLIQVKQKWEYAIDKLYTILTMDKKVKLDTKPSNSRRLVWRIDLSMHGVEVVEQVLRKNGEYTNGKVVSISRLAKRNDLDFMLEADNKALFAIVPDPYRKNAYEWNFGKLVFNLVGHPLVYSLTKPDLKLEFILDKPEIIVKPEKDKYFIKIQPKVQTHDYIITELNQSKYRIIEVNDKILSLAQLLNNGILVPAIAKDKILQLLTSEVDLVKLNAEISDKDLITKKANSDLYIQLIKYDDGLKLTTVFKPFGEKAGVYLAGAGSSSLIVRDEVQGSIKLVRDLALENELVQSFANFCPVLNGYVASHAEWVIPDLEASLDVLSEIAEYKKEHKLIIEWPNGEAINFKAKLDHKNLRLNIKSKGGWFEYEGDVAINLDESLNIKTLLELLKEDSKFIQLKDGEFITLTQNLKQQLLELKTLSEGNKIFNLSTQVLEDLIDEGASAKLDKKWQEHRKNLEKRAKFTPQLPSTLQADLRDYQLDGFNYLSRLVNWEIGACLADDMGLGKTVQAISLLLEQAHNGASLVIAPTSVCFNWVSELTKFAPNLTPYLLHDEDKREELIKKIDKLEVIICSYNLLQYQSEIFNSREWSLVILDEAQNIKNHTTKRFKAACSLNTKRRVALSGTPIENHLGELWSIFRFLNPGLLGSLDSFQKRFINPIANGDVSAKRTLRQLLQAFILRRTKTQVLCELPPKIEKALYIEPQAAEMAFYEAVRLQAMENITKLNDVDKKRFSILAEITKLRQACCHASLVNPSINIENSKLNAFLDIIDELKENKHKVLVFSQYVRYLELVKTELDKKAIQYQYIDGSTPINQRKKNVELFQSGNGGDAFLISLKAGGAGLNLTAADYVIILDPWWNPAVEDQATDRAHRIGQTRPVTVYRLIMKNTIEEKIINLHKDKRDLAGDLLSGQDVGAKLSEEELLGLINL